MGTLKQVRADTHEMLEFAGKVKQEFIDGINVTQDQVYVRALVVDFFISLLNTVEAWAERTLAEIETWDDLSPDGKTSGHSKRSESYLLRRPNRSKKRRCHLAANSARAVRGILSPRYVSHPTPSWSPSKLCGSGARTVKFV